MLFNSRANHFAVEQHGLNKPYLYLGNTFISDMKLKLNLQFS